MAFTLSGTGSMWQIGSHTSSAGWYSSVFTAKHPTTCLSCVCQWLKSLNDSNFVQPAATCSSPPRFQLDIFIWSSCLCCGCDSNLELTSNDLRNLDRHSATFWHNLKMFLFQQNALSALEVLCDYALYKSTFTLHYIMPTDNQLSHPSLRGR